MAYSFRVLDWPFIAHASHTSAHRSKTKKWKQKKEDKILRRVRVRVKRFRRQRYLISLPNSVHTAAPDYIENGTWIVIRQFCLAKRKVFRTIFPFFHVFFSLFHHSHSTSKYSINIWFYFCCWYCSENLAVICSYFQCGTKLSLNENKK